MVIYLVFHRAEMQVKRALCCRSVDFLMNGELYIMNVHLYFLSPGLHTCQIVEFGLFEVAFSFYSTYIASQQLISFEFQILSLSPF